MTLTQLFSIAKPLTFLFTASFGACVAANAGHAAAKIAVFDFELEHGSLVPGAPDHHDAEQARLRMVSERLRDDLARPGLPWSTLVLLITSIAMCSRRGWRS
jgi:hypothetical protein